MLARTRPADRRRESWPVSSDGSTDLWSKVSFSSLRNGEVSTALSRQSATWSACVLTFSVTGPAYKLDEFADQVRYVVRWLNWFTSHGPA